jgi:hypothetical protein
MEAGMGQAPDWMTKGKTIAGLIRELGTFDDQELEVRISTDGGVTTHPISLVGRQDGACVLMRCWDPPGTAAGPAPGERPAAHRGAPVVATSGDQPWTDATVRADVGYDPTVFDLDRLQTAIEDKLRELPVEVFGLHVDDEA